MNTLNKNTSYQSWCKSNFKKTVRYILSDLKTYPNYYLMDTDDGVSKEAMELMNKLTSEYKQICVDLWNRFEEEGDFGSWQKELDWKLKVCLMMKIIWVEGDSWEDPDYVYNSFHIDLDDYDFRLKEMAHDAYICEMCETNGWGYDSLQQYVKQYDDEGEELPF